MTVGAYIVEQIKAGVDPVNAAGVVGVPPAEFQSWMREGTLTRAKLNAGADWNKDLTPEQQDAVWFADEVVRAHSTHIATLSVLAEQAARGGVAKRRTTTTTDGTGTITDVVETVELSLPDSQMMRWKLEKLEPQVYGSRATLNLNVSDLTDTDAVADVVEKRMREVADQLAASLVVETTAVEVDP